MRNYWLEKRHAESLVGQWVFFDPTKMSDSFYIGLCWFYTNPAKVIQVSFDMGFWEAEVDSFSMSHYEANWFRIVPENFDPKTDP